MIILPVICWVRISKDLIVILSIAKLYAGNNSTHTQTNYCTICCGSVPLHKFMNHNAHAHVEI